MRIFASLMFILFIGTACSAPPSLPSHADFAIGMNQKDIRSQFGEPIKIESFSKTNNHIFGAIKSYWSTIPVGSTVVVWTYKSENQRGKGNTELYFLNDELKVSGIGFAPEGVIY